MNIDILIETSDIDADPERLDQLAGRLRHDLLELDVDSVVAARAPDAPAGSKGLDMADIGSLLVSMKMSIDLAEKVVSVIRGWIKRSPQSRSVKITVGDKTVELSDVTVDQQQQILERLFEVPRT
jgi:hypothetical protein